MSCEIKNRQVQAGLELQSYAEDFIKVISSLEEPRASSSLKNFLKAINTTDDLVVHYFGEDFKSFSDFAKRGTSDQKAFFRNAMNDMLKEVYRAVDNPMLLGAAVHSSSAVYGYLKYLRRLEGAPTLISGIFRTLAKAAGLEGPVMDWFMPKQAKFEQYNPARMAFYYMESIRNFADDRAKRIANKLTDLLKHTSKDTVFTDNNISYGKLVRLIPFVDGGRLKALGIDEKNLLSPNAVDLFRIHAKQVGVEIDDEEGLLILKRLYQFREDFNLLNYGVKSTDNFDGESLYHNAPEGTILAYIRSLKDKLHVMKNEMSSLVKDVDKHHIEKIDKILETLDTFTPRKNYIPFNGEDDTILNMLEAFSNSGEHGLNLSAWLKERKSPEIDPATGDFVNSFMNNLFGTAFMANDFAMYLGHSFLSKAIENDKSWFKGFARQEVYANVKNFIYSMDKLLNPPEVQRKWFAKTVYAAQTAMSIYPAAMLMNPISAIKNTLSGNLALMSRLGFEYRDKSKKGDHSSTLNRLIDEISEEELMSVGLSEEFKQYKVDSYIVDKAGKIVNSASSLKGSLLSSKPLTAFGEQMAKAADVLTEGYGLGNFSEMYHKVLTVKGTEEQLREKTKTLLFNRVYKELIARGIDSNDTTPDNLKRIKEVIDSKKVEVFYDMNNALGNYNPLNKPYMFHLQQKGADTAAKIVAGGILRWVYVFRHASFSAMENFVTSVTKITNPEANPDNKMKNLTGPAFCAALVASLVWVYDMLKDTLMSEAESGKYNTSYLDALNPNQEASAPLKGFYALTASVLNLPMDENTANEIALDNMRFFAGMINNFDKQDINELREAGMIETLSRKMDFAPHWYDLISNGTVYGRDVKAYDLFQKEREMQEEIGSRYMATGIVKDLEKTIALFTVNSRSNPEATREFRNDLLTNHLLRKAGFSFWSENEKPRKLYRKRYDGYYAEYDYDRFDDAKKEFSRLKYEKNIDNADRMLDYIRRYGRMPRQGAPV